MQHGLGIVHEQSSHSITTLHSTRYSHGIEIEHVYRVTVRGRFRDLDTRARAFLHNHRADHDIFNSAFTPEGTFVYDEAVMFFSLRYEVRTSQGSLAAAEAGLEEASQFLSTMGFSHHELKASVLDTSTMWE